MNVGTDPQLPLTPNFRCGNGGISHNPLETMTADDADIAARVLLDFIRNF